MIVLKLLKKISGQYPCRILIAKRTVKLPCPGFNSEVFFLLKNVEYIKRKFSQKHMKIKLLREVGKSGFETKV